MRVALVGNYGVGNLGDEALKEYFFMAFPQIEWVVLSAHPSDSEVPRLPFGWRSLTRTPWWRTIRALLSVDAVVFGGGSLFTDIESPKACFLWWWHARVARLLRKPVHLAFQGIGPFRSGVGEQFAMKTAMLSTSISVRDPLSKARVEAWDLNKEIVLSFDPVFSLLKDKKSGVRTNFLVIIPRRNSGDNLLNNICDLCKKTQWDEVRIVLMQPDDPGEMSFAQELVKALKNGQKVTIIPIRTIQELKREVSGAGRVVSQRFHGALAAIALGSPVDIVLQEKGDKLEIVKDAEQRGEEALQKDVERGEEALRRVLCV